MLLLILDIYHLVALLAFAYIPTAVSLVQVDSIHRERLIAIAAQLILNLHSVSIQNK